MSEGRSFPSKCPPLGAGPDDHVVRHRDVRSDTSPTRRRPTLCLTGQCMAMAQEYFKQLTLIQRRARTRMLSYDLWCSPCSLVQHFATQSRSNVFMFSQVFEHASHTNTDNQTTQHRFVRRSLAIREGPACQSRTSRVLTLLLQRQTSRQGSHLTSSSCPPWHCCPLSPLRSGTN